MKRFGLFQVLLIVGVAFVIAYPLAVFMGQGMQGHEGNYRYSGQIASISDKSVDAETVVLVELSHVAVFCEEQKGCDEAERTFYNVENVALDELVLGQPLSVSCTVAPIKWTLEFNYDRVTCEVVK